MKGGLMNSFERRLCWVCVTVCLGLILTVPASAEPSIEATFPSCVPSSGNSVATVTLKPDTGWALVRVYFRATEEKAEYYMEMRATGNGSFFAVLPKPESGTSAVEMYVMARDAEGRPVKSGPITVKVASGCEVKLTEEQQRYAQNLVVGNTAADQEGKVVEGFLCDGIVSRIDIKGALRPDEQCRRVLIAAATSGSALIPALALGAAGAGVLIVDRDDKEPNSPSR